MALPWSDLAQEWSRAHGGQEVVKLRSRRRARRPPAAAAAAAGAVAHGVAVTPARASSAARPARRGGDGDGARACATGGEEHKAARAPCSHPATLLWSSRARRGGCSLTSHSPRGWGQTIAALVATWPASVCCNTLAGWRWLTIGLCAGRGAPEAGERKCLRLEPTPAPARRRFPPPRFKDVDHAAVGEVVRPKTRPPSPPPLHPRAWARHLRPGACACAGAVRARRPQSRGPAVPLPAAHVRAARPPSRAMAPRLCATRAMCAPPRGEVRSSSVPE